MTRSKYTHDQGKQRPFEGDGGGAYDDQPSSSFSRFRAMRMRAIDEEGRD
ncbi:MAG TPA: hypothetical protein VK436_02735 [Methanocella sp.]|nr:hypothetical protein [Methanocella sp.]